MARTSRTVPPTPNPTHDPRLQPLQQPQPPLVPRPRTRKPIPPHALPIHPERVDQFTLRCVVVDGPVVSIHVSMNTILAVVVGITTTITTAAGPSCDVQGFQRPDVNLAHLAVPVGDILDRNLGGGDLAEGAEGPGQVEH